MASIRSDGYAVSRDQADVGASAIAAPVWTAGIVQGSVGVAVPNQRFVDESEGRLTDHVTQAATVISRRLGDPFSVLPRGRLSNDAERMRCAAPRWVTIVRLISEVRSPDCG